MPNTVSTALVTDRGNHLLAKSEPYFIFNDLPFSTKKSLRTPAHREFANSQMAYRSVPLSYEDEKPVST